MIFDYPLDFIPILSVNICDVWMKLTECVCSQCALASKIHELGIDIGLAPHTSNNEMNNEILKYFEYLKAIILFIECFYQLYNILGLLLSAGNKIFAKSIKFLPTTFLATGSRFFRGLYCFCTYSFCFALLSYSHKS